MSTNYMYLAGRLALFIVPLAVKDPAIDSHTPSYLVEGGVATSLTAKT